MGGVSVLGGLGQLMHSLEVEGAVCPIPGLIAAEDLPVFRAEAERLAGLYPASAHGLRGLLGKSPLYRSWLVSGGAEHVVPPGYLPVRSILFDKPAGANWKVAWHQDLTLAVRDRHDVPGYGPWSVKEGVPHVQPPVEFLQRMITLRVHLDDTGEENGALRVIQGSHAQGRLTAAAIADWRSKGAERLCTAAAGEALLMKPLVLHASSPAVVPRHRRVIHLEFAPKGLLPEPLDWAEAGTYHSW